MNTMAFNPMAFNPMAFNPMAFNPITKRKITFGGRVYKSLISQGYTDEQLQVQEKVEEKVEDKHKMNEDVDRVIKIASNVVAEAFYQDRICQACLPASLILAEMLEKHGIKTQLVYGFSLITSSDRKCAARHVWLEYNGKSIDVGGMIFEKFMGVLLQHITNRKISTELPGDVSYMQINKDFETALEAIKKCGVDWYWNRAPYKLHEIHRRLCKC
jgi:hypothetical protein